ncbi:hypothetical protein BSKO_10629 [Bryopsis sp. KO-2023]|nr:hypothetical protein BSKO_10629 [Bryopsis sp. KO-2023]
MLKGLFVGFTLIGWFVRFANSQQPLVREPARCSGSGDEDCDDKNSIIEKQTCTSVFQILKLDPELQTMASAVEVAGLVKYFSGSDMGTELVAPTDFAFKEFFRRSGIEVEEFLSNRPLVVKVVGMHILGGAFSTKTDGFHVSETASGSTVNVLKEGDEITFMIPNRGSTTSHVTIPACGSVIHKANDVLNTLPRNPPSESPAGTKRHEKLHQGAIVSRGITITTGRGASPGAPTGSVKKREVPAQPPSSSKQAVGDDGTEISTEEEEEEDPVGLPPPSTRRRSRTRRVEIDRDSDGSASEEGNEEEGETAAFTAPPTRTRPRSRPVPVATDIDSDEAEIGGDKEEEEGDEEEEARPIIQIVSTGIKTSKPATPPVITSTVSSSLGGLTSRAKGDPIIDSDDDDMSGEPEEEPEVEPAEEDSDVEAILEADIDEDATTGPLTPTLAFNPFLDPIPQETEEVALEPSTEPDQSDETGQSPGVPAEEQFLDPFRAYDESELSKMPGLLPPQAEEPATPAPTEELDSSANETPPQAEEPATPAPTEELDSSVDGTPLSSSPPKSSSNTDMQPSTPSQVSAPPSPPVAEPSPPPSPASPPPPPSTELTTSVPSSSSNLEAPEPDAAPVPMAEKEPPQSSLEGNPADGSRRINRTRRAAISKRRSPTGSISGARRRTNIW